MKELNITIPMKSLDVKMVDEKKGILEISYSTKAIENSIGKKIAELLSSPV